MGTRVAVEMTIDIPALRRKLLPGGESVCAKCKQIKPVSEFYKRVASPIGILYSCKTCQNKLVNRSKRRATFNRRHTEELNA